MFVKVGSESYSQDIQTHRYAHTGLIAPF